MSWTPSTLTVLLFGAVSERLGFERDGLGLVMVIPASPELKLTEQWILFHLESGHAIVGIGAARQEAFAIGDDVLAFGDWSFEAPTGWQNHIPDLLPRLQQLEERYSGKIIQLDAMISEPLAQQVLAKREDEQSNRSSSCRKGGGGERIK